VTSYLLDTNAVSELHRRRPDEAVMAWFDRATASDLYLSVLTIGELRQGIENLRRRDRLGPRRWRVGTPVFSVPTPIASSRLTPRSLTDGDASAFLRADLGEPSLRALVGTDVHAKMDLIRPRFARGHRARACSGRRAKSVHQEPLGPESLFTSDEVGLLIAALDQVRLTAVGVAAA